MEYRAKQAMLDMNEWTLAIKALLDNNFKSSIGAEWQPSWMNPLPWIATPYAKTTTSGTGLITPEFRTTPGWSGANQIPFIIFNNTSTVVINFQPIGANMTCQLCYRTIDGVPVYSQPVSSGNCTLRLDKKPKNNIVFAVICNTDYKYLGEATRKAHYDYRLQLVKGIVHTADIYTKWYDFLPVTSVDENSPVKISTPHADIFPNPASCNRSITIEFNHELSGPKNISITNLQGQVLKSLSTLQDDSYTFTPEGYLKKGLYFVTIHTPTQEQTLKLFVSEN
jgi:hypothetical protein